MLIRTTSRENATLMRATNKGEDKKAPILQCFIIHSLVCIISITYHMPKCTILVFVYVVEQAGLSITWSQTLVFSRRGPFYSHTVSIVIVSSIISIKTKTYIVLRTTSIKP